MKKTIFFCLLFILLGFILGKKYIKIEQPKEVKYYFLQQGEYDNNKIFEENISNLKEKVMEYKDNKIYLYIGITKDIEIAEKLKEIYNNKGIPLKVEEKYLTSEEFSINLDQLDLLVKESSTEEEILKIQEVVLATYEEMLKKEEEY